MVGARVNRDTPLPQVEASGEVGRKARVPRALFAPKRNRYAQVPGTFNDVCSEPPRAPPLEPKAAAISLTPRPRFRRAP
jgi:hypothetical protein